MIIELDGKAPQVADDAFIAPTAVLIGDVTVHAGASIWFGAVGNAQRWVETAAREYQAKRPRYMR